MNNLFSNLPAEISSELIDSLVEKPGIRIERIVSQGQVTAAGEWYDQEENEWVIVLRGKARLHLEGDDRMREMGPGDYLNIPAHQRHRVEWTDPDEPTFWLAVFYGAEENSSDPSRKAASPQG